MILNGFVSLPIVTFLESNTESKRNIVTNNKSMNFLKIGSRTEILHNRRIAVVW